MYCVNIRNKWRNSNYTVYNFFKKHSAWLDNDISWPHFVKVYLPGKSSDTVIYSNPESLGELDLVETEETSSDLKTNSSELMEQDSSGAFTLTRKIVPTVNTSVISPRKPFSELGPKQKQKRAKSTSSNFSSEELLQATYFAFQENGDEAMCAALKFLMNPDNVKKFFNVMNSVKHQVTKYSAEKALCLMTSLKLSKWQYCCLRNSIKIDNTHILPSYHKIIEAKKLCYPPEKEIDLSDSGVKISLQSLLDITVRRLSPLVTTKLCDSDNDKQVQLISKWGMDGASSQSTYRQITEESAYIDDSSIFMSSLVPLKLLCGNDVLWENKQPSSTMFCRPLFFKFAKENSLNIKEETEKIMTEFKNLNPSYFKEGVSVTHQLLMTMVDGKIISNLSETSNQVCDICKAKPSEMNKLIKLKDRNLSTDVYKYGLSSLHSWIRCMETILHIAYRLQFKTWTARGDKKAIMEKRKSEIQKRFRDETGLLVDIVKQGCGTTNNGNTARRFFADPQKTSAITGVNQDLIARFAILLRPLASGEQIDPQKFTQYAWETAQLFVQLYSWYYMPSSVHKLLIHGGDIIKYLDIMPIGALSEEAAESRNKDFRKIRESYTRKFNRKVTNRDIINNLLISSDPFLSTMRPKMGVITKYVLPNEVKLLLASTVEEVDEPFEFVSVDDPLYSSTDVE